jgi:hypothetical protein
LHPRGYEDVIDAMAAEAEFTNAPQRSTSSSV